MIVEKGGDGLFTTAYHGNSGQSYTANRGDNGPSLFASSQNYRWYIIGAIVTCSLVFLLGLGTCLYRCYRRRRERAKSSPSNGEREQESLRLPIRQQSTESERNVRKTESLRRLLGATTMPSEAAPTTRRIAESSADVAEVRRELPKIAEGSSEKIGSISSSRSSSLRSSTKSSTSTKSAARLFSSDRHPDVTVRAEHRVEKIRESGIERAPPCDARPVQLAVTGGGSAYAALQSEGAASFPKLSSTLFAVTRRNDGAHAPQFFAVRGPEMATEATGEQSETSGGLGQLEFVLEYDRSKSALLVTIVKIIGLRANGSKTSGEGVGGGARSHAPDPYIKLQLLPERRQKVKTRVLRETRNPVYDETFTFYDIEAEQLGDVILHFVVLGFDRYSRDDVIGEVVFPLDGPEAVGLAATEAEAEEGGVLRGHHVAITRDIDPRHIRQANQDLGDLLVSLCYQPSANRLSLVVLKARNLPKLDNTGLAYPYVKIYLLYNGQRISKKKTHVKNATLNPVFNESFQFDLPPDESLENISLELVVLAFDRMTKNEVFGRLRLGAQVTSSPETANHWKEIMGCPRKQVADWHKLVD